MLRDCLKSLPAHGLWLGIRLVFAVGFEVSCCVDMCLVSVFSSCCCDVYYLCPPVPQHFAYVHCCKQLQLQHVVLQLGHGVHACQNSLGIRIVLLCHIPVTFRQLCAAGSIKAY